jgi:hypothetical protein
MPILFLYLSLLIDGIHSFKLLVGGKARIRLSLSYELLCENVVDRTALALIVRSVDALLSVDGSALVKLYSVMVKRDDKLFSRTLYLTLCVGILYTENENSSALVCKTLTDGRGEKSAEMQKSRGAGGKSRYLGALLKLTLWKSLKALLGAFRYLGEKKLGKLCAKLRIFKIKKISKPKKNCRNCCR